MRNTTLECLDRLSRAIAQLGLIQNGKTLFEMKITESDECLAAWMELDAAQKMARQAIVEKHPDTLRNVSTLEIERLARALPLRDERTIYDVAKALIELRRKEN